MAGCNARMTNGNATNVCATGTINGEVSHFPNVRRNPSPSMTAEEPSGSMMNGSRSLSRAVGLERATAAGKPMRIERITVAEAYVIEFRIA